MNKLEQYLDWVIARLNQDEVAREEPDLELKSDYDHEIPETEARWELSDLVAALANDPRIDGYRSLVYGPSEGLTRPKWLADESQLRDKLLRHFDGAVVPGVELIRREIPRKGVIDAFVLIERDSTPYVTRLSPGGAWVVRVRTNTARRTATRAELLALAKGRRSTGDPVRRLDVRVAPLGKGTRKIVVTNVGTISVSEIRLDVPEGAETRLFGNKGVIELLNPGERDVIPIAPPGGFLGSSTQSERINICGTAEDGEPVVTSLIVSSFD